MGDMCLGIQSESLVITAGPRPGHGGSPARPTVSQDGPMLPRIWAILPPFTLARWRPVHSPGRRLSADHAASKPRNAAPAGGLGVGCCRRSGGPGHAGGRVSPDGCGKRVVGEFPLAGGHRHPDAHRQRASDPEGAVDYAGQQGLSANTKVIGSYPAAQLAGGSVKQAVYTSAGGFLRTQIVASTGAIIATSNPVWLLRNPAERPLR